MLSFLNFSELKINIQKLISDACESKSDINAQVFQNLYCNNSANENAMYVCGVCLYLFHLKSFFRSRDIQIFVIFSLPFHFPGSVEQMEME